MSLPYPNVFSFVGFESKQVIYTDHLMSPIWWTFTGMHRLVIELRACALHTTTKPQRGLGHGGPTTSQLMDAQAIRSPQSTFESSPHDCSRFPHRGRAVIPQVNPKSWELSSSRSGSMECHMWDHGREPLGKVPSSIRICQLTTSEVWHLAIKVNEIWIFLPSEHFIVSVGAKTT